MKLYTLTRKNAVRSVTQALAHIQTEKEKQK
nr:MAG TPA: hypothetical protein [Caudoviricetes sp.]